MLNKPGKVEAVEFEHSISFTKLDLRIGQITKIWEHESSDRLYCEEVDCGDGTGPRTVASALRDKYQKEDLLGRKVVVVCNLKESKFQGFLSSAMVLAAKDGDRLELLEPPADARIGDSIFLPGHESAAGRDKAWNANKIKKNRVWEEVSEELKTNEEGVAAYRGLPFSTAHGVCRVPSLANAKVQ